MGGVQGLWKDASRHGLEGHGDGGLHGALAEQPPRDLCLHCMEGMVAELLSGRGRLLLGPDERTGWCRGCFAPAGRC